MAIELTPVSIEKESQQIRAFEFNQALVAPQSIPQLIEINFPPLKSNKVGRFNLDAAINCDLLVKNLTIDIKHDDADEIASAQYHTGNSPLILFLVNPTNQKVVRKVTAIITGYPIEPFYFVFKRGLDIYLKSASEFHSLTFYCEPVYVSNVVNLEKIES